jgi:hypothetical protein
MFAKSNYSKKTLSTFEIVGAYVVDLFYNHFYQSAKSLHINGRVDSTTDGYKHVVKGYLASFNNPDLYKKTVIGIHKYYYTTTRYASISFTECIDEIVKTFIPEEFFDATTNKMRDTALRKVLIGSIKQFSVDVLCSEILDTIIDDHNNAIIVRKMQDKMVQALMFEREKMFQDFFKGVNESNNHGNFAMIQQMREKMVVLVKEKHTIAEKYRRLKCKIEKLLIIIKKQQEQLNSMKEPDNEELERSEHIHDKRINEFRKQMPYNDQVSSEPRVVRSLEPDDGTLYVSDSSPLEEHVEHHQQILDYSDAVKISDESKFSEVMTISKNEPDTELNSSEVQPSNTIPAHSISPHVNEFFENEILDIE